MHGDVSSLKRVGLDPARVISSAHVLHPWNYIQSSANIHVMPIDQHTVQSNPKGRPPAPVAEHCHWLCGAVDASPVTPLPFHFAGQSYSA